MFRGFWEDSLTKPPFGVTNRRFGRYNLPRYNQTNLVYNMKTYWYYHVRNSRAILCDVKNLVCQECFTVKADFNKITRRKTNSSPLKIPEHLWSEDNPFLLGQTCCEFQVRIPWRILEVAGGDCHTHMLHVWNIYLHLR